MTQVMACIDGSHQTSAVCACAVWASQRLGSPLSLLHVLDQYRYPLAGDFSGIIGLGSREFLLEELASLDDKRNKLAFEEGSRLLETASRLITEAGAPQPQVHQRHGALVETLRDLESDIRLLVIGKQGEGSGDDARLIGSQLESVIRTMHRPILVTPANFRPPTSAMFAFDASETARKGVEMLASSPLLQGIPIHLVSVSSDAFETRAAMNVALDRLEAAGLNVRAAIIEGAVESALRTYQNDHAIELVVMGAYGHSRIRQFLIGSTTTNMLRSASTPLLLLR